MPRHDPDYPRRHQGCPVSQGPCSGGGGYPGAAEHGQGAFVCLGEGAGDAPRGRGGGPPARSVSGCAHVRHSAQGGQDRAEGGVRRPVPGGCGATVCGQQPGGANDRHPAHQHPGEKRGQAGGDAGHSPGDCGGKGAGRRSGGGGGRPHFVSAPLCVQNLRPGCHRERGAKGPDRRPILPGGQGQAGPVRHFRHPGAHARG